MHTKTLTYIFSYFGSHSELKRKQRCLQKIVHISKIHKMYTMLIKHTEFRLHGRPNLYDNYIF